MFLLKMKKPTKYYKIFSCLNPLTINIKQNNTPNKEKFIQLSCGACQMEKTSTSRQTTNIIASWGKEASIKCPIDVIFIKIIIAALLPPYLLA